MSKRRSLTTAILFAVLVIVFFIFVQTSMSQEVIVNIDVVEGAVTEQTNFSSLTKIGDDVYIKDSYQSKFRTFNANTTFSKTFGTSGVVTNITSMSNSYIVGKEVIGTAQIAGIVCCAAAAGSKFTVNAIEYKGVSSPGGLGACCGVNFSADIPQSVGRIAGAVIYEKIGEEITEGEEPVTTFENSFQKTEVGVNGSQNGFNFTTIAPICTPAEGPPEEPFFKFELCTGEMNPWEVTP